MLTKKQKLKNKYYHSKDKGCDLLPQIKIREQQGKKYLTRGFKCITHKNKFVCRCGWEFGFHYKK